MTCRYNFSKPICKYFEIFTIMQTNSAYMLFYERMKVVDKGCTEGQQDTTSTEANQATATDSLTVARVEADDDDRHKLKIELSPELADVSQVIYDL